MNYKFVQVLFYESISNNMYNGNGVYDKIYLCDSRGILNRKGDLVLDRERLLKMDSYILLSWVNMKLRDEFSSLGDLCDDYDIRIYELEEKLKPLGYRYFNSTNQFVAVDEE
jgi:hypothetical protein